MEINPTARNSYGVAADVAARALSIQRDHFAVDRPEDFPAVFRGMVEKGDRGLLVWGSPFMSAHRKQIVDLASTHRIVAVVYEGNGWVEAGGLMSYGASSLALWRRTASYVDRILKGAKPADLPIEQPSTFELVINLKAAKALGFTIPPSVLMRTDHIIE